MKRTRRREAQQVTSSLRLRGEIDRLERRLQGLERTIDAMLGTTDETFIDVRPQENISITPSTPSTGFAAAWGASEPSATQADAFFRPDANEMRARRWLLAQ